MNWFVKNDVHCISKNVVFCIFQGAWSRHFPAWKKVAELIDSGVIGDVMHVSASFGAVFTTPGHWTTKKEFGGGSLHSLGMYLPYPLFF